MLEFLDFPDRSGLRPRSRSTRDSHRRLRASVAALLAAAALVVTGVHAARAQTAADVNSTLDTLFGGHAPVQNFLETLKKAVADDDRAGVAGLVDYPFKTHLDGKAVTIRDAAHFIDSYDRIVTAKIRKAVADQTYANLFANWRGIMIGNGEVWFSPLEASNKIRITAINN